MLVEIYSLSLRRNKNVREKLVDTPIEQNHGIVVEWGELLHDIRSYQRLVGRLLYLTITCPNIAYAVSLVSQFMHVPITGHLNAVCMILKYLKSPGQGFLYFRHGHLMVEAYTNADWLGSKLDRRSTTAIAS